MIGSGEFGHVYKLNLTTRRKEGIIPVTVKTIDSDLNDANCFKALLAEAKVMTYLGKHENVVELIGLCTKDIRFRKLYIVLELCAFGSLHTLSERATFSPSSVIESNNETLNENQLVKWCLEIARGMEYLASQKVVHVDLATRNVHLNENRTAKITDFGLSRRLYNHSVYVRRKILYFRGAGLLQPLVDMKFSTMSDVWSYGICCWEIFELGKRPWCNYPQFTLDFISDINNGVRLEKPNSCRQNYFDDILFPYWKHERSERPKLTEIVDSWRPKTKPLMPNTF